MEIETYKSNGSDGFTAGTFGCIVRVGGKTYQDGGWPTRQLARNAGRKLAASLR
jgi:hypothetical protein